MILGFLRIWLVSKTKQATIKVYRWPYSSTVTVKLWCTKQAQRNRYRPRILKVKQVTWDKKQDLRRHHGKWWVYTGTVKKGEWEAAKTAFDELMAD